MAATPSSIHLSICFKKTFLFHCMLSHISLISGMISISRTWFSALSARWYSLYALLPERTASDSALPSRPCSSLISASFLSRSRVMAFSSIEAIRFLRASFSSVNRPFSFCSCLFCSIMTLTFCIALLYSAFPSFSISCFWSSLACMSAVCISVRITFIAFRRSSLHSFCPKAGIGFSSSVFMASQASFTSGSVFKVGTIRSSSLMSNAPA